MKTIKLTLGILSITSLFAFKTINNYDKNIIGNYGDKNLCEISLNEDKTFNYFDYTKNKNIKSTGSWEIVNDEVILKSDVKSKIITKWTLTNNGSCLKSKKGLTTYTLCKKCN
jgi:hypothetical protein